MFIAYRFKKSERFRTTTFLHIYIIQYIIALASIKIDCSEKTPPMLMISVITITEDTL